LRGDTLILAAVHCTVDNSHVASATHCGFQSPGYPGPTFLFTPFFTVGSFSFTKPMLLALVCSVVVVGFFWAAFANPKIVPGSVQNLGEMGVEFVREQILRPMIGKRGDSFLPFLVSLFFFIWMMNLMEIIPVAQFPPMSMIAFPVALMLMVYGTYTYLGIKHQGLGGYFSNMIPKGVPPFVLGLLAPVEVLQYVLIRPFTLAVRLFANMFAGHILLLIFTLSTDRADRVRDADPGPAGLHLHHSDRPVHRRFPGSGSLTWPAPTFVRQRTEVCWWLTQPAGGRHPSA
jgi:F-type H+-transporting ATPase subunit a